MSSSRFYCALFNVGTSESKSSSPWPTKTSIVEGLKSGTFDIGLIIGDEPREAKGLCSEKLASYEIRVAVHPRHRFADLSEVPLLDLVKEPSIALCGKDSPVYSKSVTTLLEPYRNVTSVSEDHADPLSAIASIEAGRGVAICYETLAKVAGERVVLRRLTPSPPPTPVKLLYREEGLTALMADFIGAAKSLRRLPESKSRVPVPK